MTDYKNIFGELEEKINRLSETSASAVHNLVLSVDALTDATMKTMQKIRHLQETTEYLVKGMRVWIKQPSQEETKIRAKFQGYSKWELAREYSIQYENYINGTGYYNLYEMDVLEEMMKEAIEND